MKIANVYITSIDVVLLDTSDACIMTKQRRLKANAILRTALWHRICKKQKDNYAELKLGNVNN